MIIKHLREIPTGPLCGTLNTGGVYKFRDFRPAISNLTNEKSAIVTMEVELYTAPKLLNGTSFNDLESPLTQISRSRHYSTPNNSKMV